MLNVPARHLVTALLFAFTKYDNGSMKFSKFCRVR
jgi:hypothetical protein